MAYTILVGYTQPALAPVNKQLIQGNGDLQGLTVLKVSFPSLTLTSMATGLTSPWILMVRLCCCTWARAALNEWSQVPISLLV